MWSQSKEDAVVMRRVFGIAFAVFLSVMLLTVVLSVGQAWANPPTGGWSKTYGGTSNDVAYALVQTADGGYALAGYTESYGTGGSDFWLVKTDVNGVVPEFPSYTILAALLVVTSLAVVLKEEVSRKPNSAFRASSHLQNM
jgi:hypothetical protein